MINNENVNTSWESLSRNIPNEALSMIVKKQFMLKWIDIRARSYVRTYVQILKSKISKKSDPAARKKKNCSSYLGCTYFVNLDPTSLFF